ncbi:hypothetical protein C8Q76DRAFT_695118 [Earliella scabrosa]|nr:hypothetical protein C8Q76DRAFT_695118 [Earliella scabrosa]
MAGSKNFDDNALQRTVNDYVCEGQPLYNDENQYFYGTIPDGDNSFQALCRRIPGAAAETMGVYFTPYPHKPLLGTFTDCARSTSQLANGETATADWVDLHVLYNRRDVAAPTLQSLSAMVYIKLDSGLRSALAVEVWPHVPAGGKDEALANKALFMSWVSFTAGKPTCVFAAFQDTGICIIYKTYDDSNLGAAHHTIVRRVYWKIHRPNLNAFGANNGSSLPPRRGSPRRGWLHRSCRTGFVHTPRDATRNERQVCHPGDIEHAEAGWHENYNAIWTAKR